MKQLCRELLLLESSDWQFLITTGAARDYAELRFLTHHDQFIELRRLWFASPPRRALNDEQLNRLTAIEERDNIFADIDPSLWSTGSHATPSRTAPMAPPKSHRKITPIPRSRLPSPMPLLSEVHKYVLPIEHVAEDADDPA